MVPRRELQKIPRESGISFVCGSERAELLLDFEEEHDVYYGALAPRDLVSDSALIAARASYSDSDTFHAQLQSIPSEELCQSLAVAAIREEIQVVIEVWDSTLKTMVIHYG